MIKHQTRIKTLLLLFTLLFPCTVSVCSDDKNFAWKPSPDKDVLKCGKLNYMQNKNNVCNKEVQVLIGKNIQTRSKFEISAEWHVGTVNFSVKMIVQTTLDSDGKISMCETMI